jgi:sigma-E factor negative regulatory protein RseB
MENTGTRPRAGAAGLRRGRLGGTGVILALTALLAAPRALAEDVTAWLERTAAAARDLNYIGTIVYQHGARVETSRLIHWNDGGSEREKLVSLDGPPREVIRSGSEARCYYPEAKLIRVEPRALRNAFPSLSLAERRALFGNYLFHKAEAGRVAGLAAQAYVFEPKDGLRYGRKFWVDDATGLLLKARIANERGDVIEQFSFTDLTIGAKIDSKMLEPTWTATAPDWRMQNAATGEIVPRDTGWFVGRLPAGFSKIAEGYRSLHARRDPVVHLVYSDGLVAVSVFIEKGGSIPPRPLGLSQQGGVNVYVRPVDDRIVTVLGEVPGTTVRQIAYSVSHR